MLTGGQIWCRFYQLKKVSVPDMIYFVDASDEASSVIGSFRLGHKKDFTKFSYVLSR